MMIVAAWTTAFKVSCRFLETCNYACPLVRGYIVLCAGDVVLLLCCAGNQVAPSRPDAHPRARCRPLPLVVPAVLPQLSADCEAGRQELRTKPDQPDQ